MVPCSDLDLWPTSRWNMLPRGGPQLSEYSCWMSFFAHSYCHHVPSIVHKQLTFSTSSPEPLDGFWWNLVGLKNLWCPTSTSVLVFGPGRAGSRVTHILAYVWEHIFSLLSRSTSSLQPLNGFWQKLTGNKSSMSYSKFVFFRVNHIDCIGLWLAAHFPLSLSSLNRIRWNLTRFS